jgi:hypothetical protein
VETHGASGFASGFYDLGPSRGRTIGRAPQDSTCSRNSSASSARSMIDERMEWANEERSQSSSRPAPEPASPFRESSPYHPYQQESQIAAWGVSPSFTLPLTENPALPAPSASNIPTKEDYESWIRKTCIYHSRLFSRHAEQLKKETERHWHPDEATHLERVKQALPGVDPYLVGRFRYW